MYWRQNKCKLLDTIHLYSESFFRLKPLDIEFMKRLHDKVNVIPLIAKADTLTPEECQLFKKQVCVFVLMCEFLWIILQLMICLYNFSQVLQYYCSLIIRLWRRSRSTKSRSMSFPTQRMMRTANWSER